jgi:hypothetical protein
VSRITTGTLSPRSHIEVKCQILLLLDRSITFKPAKICLRNYNMDMCIHTRGSVAYHYRDPIVKVIHVHIRAWQIIVKYTSQKLGYQNAISPLMTHFTSPGRRAMGFVMACIYCIMRCLHLGLCVNISLLLYENCLHLGLCVKYLYCYCMRCLHLGPCVKYFHCYCMRCLHLGLCVIRNDFQIN